MQGTSMNFNSTNPFVARNRFVHEQTRPPSCTVTVGKLPHSPSQISSLAAALGPVEDVLPAITFQHDFMRGSLMVVTTYVSKFHNFIFDGRFAPFAFFRQVPQYVHTRHTQIFIEY